MSGPHAPEGDDYSATVLGSHWFSGPPQPQGATRRPEVTQRLDTPATVQGAAPDRVDGPVLRFGPGVTAGDARCRSR
ncbi:hypothetical protein ACFSNO_06280 [Streptomyces cirratus]